MTCQYRVTFCGRLKGAIGAFESFDLIVDAPNADIALMNLYDTHEHISAAVVERQATS